MITVADVLKMKKGATIDDFSAVVKKIYDAKKVAGFEGKGFNFEQNIVFAGGKSEIYGKLILPLKTIANDENDEWAVSYIDDQTAYELWKPEMEGRVVKLGCTETKHGLKGCIKHSWEKNGKIYHQIKLSGMAKVEFVPLANEVPEEPQTAQEGGNQAVLEAKAPNTPIYTPPDWTGKERRELKSKIWNSALMTIYPKLGNDIEAAFTNEQIVKIIEQYAEAGWQFVQKNGDSKSVTTDDIYGDDSKVEEVPF